MSQSEAGQVPSDLVSVSEQRNHVQKYHETSYSIFGVFRKPISDAQLKRYLLSCSFLSNVLPKVC